MLLDPESVQVNEPPIRVTSHLYSLQLTLACPAQLQAGAEGVLVAARATQHTATLRAITPMAAAPPKQARDALAELRVSNAAPAAHAAQGGPASKPLRIKLRVVRHARTLAEPQPANAAALAKAVAVSTQAPSETVRHCVGGSVLLYLSVM